MNSWHRAQRVLSDPYRNVWCAWCLRYIDHHSHLELHHVIGKKGTVERTLGYEPWVVPVHSPPERCHRKHLQDYADKPARALLDARRLKDFDERCKHAFYLGYLPACLYLHRDAALKGLKAGQTAAASKHLALALNAAAGSGIGSNFLRSLPTDPHFAPLLDEPNIRLYVASARANHGDLSAARAACSQLEAELPRVAARISGGFPKFARTKVILHPDLQGARETVVMARESHDPQYHSCTSRLTLASAHMTAANYVATLDVAGELASLMQTGPALWWHRIHLLVLTAMATLGSAGARPRRTTIRQALITLIQAQYAAAFLDWAGIPLPDSLTGGSPGALVSPRPTDLLHWLGTRLHFTYSRTELLEIRNEALLENRASRGLEKTWPVGFQAQVLNTLLIGLPPDPIGHPMPPMRAVM